MHAVQVLGTSRDGRPVVSFGLPSTIATSGHFSSASRIEAALPNMLAGAPQSLGAGASWAGTAPQHRDWILWSVGDSFTWSRLPSLPPAATRALCLTGPSPATPSNHEGAAFLDQPSHTSRNGKGTKRPREGGVLQPFHIVASSPAKRPALAGDPPPPLLLAYLEGGLASSGAGIALPALAGGQAVDGDGAAENDDEAELPGSPFANLRNMAASPPRPLELPPPAQSGSAAAAAAAATTPAAAVKAAAGEGWGGTEELRLLPGILGHVLSFLTLPETLRCAGVSRVWDREVSVSRALEWVDVGRYFRGNKRPDPVTLHNLGRRICRPVRCLSVAYCSWVGFGDVLMLLGMQASMAKQQGQLRDVSATTQPPGIHEAPADAACGSMPPPSNKLGRPLHPPVPTDPLRRARRRTKRPPPDSAGNQVPTPEPPLQSAVFGTPSPRAQGRLDTSRVEGRVLPPETVAPDPAAVRQVLTSAGVASNSAGQAGVRFAQAYVEVCSTLPRGSLPVPALPPGTPPAAVPAAADAVQSLPGRAEPPMLRTLGTSVALNACWNVAQLDLADVRSAWRRGSSAGSAEPFALRSSATNRLPAARYCLAVADMFLPWFALHAVQAAYGRGEAAAAACLSVLPAAWRWLTPPSEQRLLDAAVPVLRTRVPGTVHPQHIADAMSEHYQLLVPAPASPGAVSPHADEHEHKHVRLLRAEEHYLTQPLKAAVFSSPITVLDLAGCVGLHTDNLPLLAPYLPELQTLRLNGCNQLQSEHLCQALAYWPKLTHLDLDYAEHCVTNDVLAALGRHCPHLRRLYLTGGQHLTDVAFSADSGLLCGCKELATLKLTGCRELTDAAVRSIALRCANLQEVILSGNRNVTASALAELLVSCPALLRLKAEMWLDAQPTAIRQRQADSVGEVMAASAAATDNGQARDAEPTSYRVVRNIDSALRYLARVLPPGHVASKQLQYLREQRGVTAKPESLRLLHDDHLVKQLDRQMRQ